MLNVPSELPNKSLLHCASIKFPAGHQAKACRCPKCQSGLLVLRCATNRKQAVVSDQVDNNLLLDSFVGLPFDMSILRADKQTNPDQA